MGASVVLVEKGKMGGDCLNYGCVPSKALLSLAKQCHGAKQAEELGLKLSKKKPDFQKIHNSVHETIARIAPHDSIERFEGLGVTVIKGNAMFVDERTVSTETALIRAKRFILATGSKAGIPPIPGIEACPYLTNETVFDLQTCPTHLVVIGGGPIGIEMAQAFRRFGADVTVLEAFKILPKDDPRMVAHLKGILLQEGITIEEGVSITRLAPNPKGCLVQITDARQENRSIQASHVLVAAGRKPNLEGLQLEAAGIAHTPRGITVNDCLQTSNPKVYAIGDCTGGYQFTHVAGYHAGIALRNSIFRLRSKVKTHAIPWVTYTDPELAHVGLTEAALAAQKRACQVLEMDFGDNDRAQAEHRIEGKIKILVNPKGKILGATILGLEAGELIFPWVLAINEELDLLDLAQTIAPYPTLSEISKKVAGQFYRDKIFSPRVRKIVKFLMRITR